MAPTSLQRHTILVIYKLFGTNITIDITHEQQYFKDNNIYNTLIQGKFITRLTITNQLPPLNKIRPTLTTLQGITPLQKSFMPTSSSMHCTICEIENIPATTRISPMNKQRKICTSSLLTKVSSSVSLVSTCISQLLPCIYQLYSCTS